MKLSAQEKRMGEIYNLLQQDLSYVYGERECGPNGIKKEFLQKAAAFLRQLGKDLGFTAKVIRSNPAGIAVSGEVTLYGAWSESGGLFFEITQSMGYPHGLLYREIKHVEDSRGGHNQWLPLSILKNADYERLCRTFLALKREGAFSLAA